MAEDSEGQRRPGIWRSLWQSLWRPSARYSLATLLVSGIVLGILFWGGFNLAMDISNTETFCISCHEMKSTVYQELKKTIHYTNRTGVRATCPDCHVPKQWQYKVVRKVEATNELFHKIMGSVNTPEKFEAQRLAMARRVWASMEATDSRECRNCHHIDSMAARYQKPAPWKKHRRARAEGLTCIKCHKGIAHKLPKGFDAFGELK